MSPYNPTLSFRILRKTYVLPKHICNLLTIRHALYKLNHFLVRPSSRIRSLPAHYSVQGGAMFRPYMWRIWQRIISWIIYSLIQFFTQLFIWYVRSIRDRIPMHFAIRNVSDRKQSFVRIRTPGKKCLYQHRIILYECEEW